MTSTAANAGAGVEPGISKKPQAVPLSLITTNTARYQSRDPEADGRHQANKARAASLDHVQELKAAVERGERLKPIIVFPLTGEARRTRRYVVLDGHHRLQAYREVHGKDAATAIPCRIFIGTELQAWFYSLGANTQTKLAMSKGQKLENAWRALATGDLPEVPAFSSRKLASHFQIGHSSIANMRGVLKEHYHGVEPELIDSWRVARNKGRDFERPDDSDREERIAKIREEYDVRIGPFHDRHPDESFEAAQAFYRTKGLRLEPIERLDALDDGYDDDPDI